jgi:tyrosine-protein kinase Etk/Wzc
MDKNNESTTESFNTALKKTSNPRQSISLFDVLLIILKHKKMIFWTTVIVAIAAIIYALFSLVLPSRISYLPNVYTAQAIIMLKSPSGSSSGGGVTSSLSEISGLAELAGIPINSAADQNSSLILSLMKQNSFMDLLAEELEFNKRSGIRDPVKATILNRQILTKSLFAKYDKDTSLLIVKYADIEKEFATTVVNRAVEILQHRFNEIILAYSREKLAIIQESIEKARGNMELAQKKFTSFQKKYGLYDLEASNSSSVGLLQGAASSLIQLQAEYKNLSAYRGAGDPQLARLAQQIEQQKEFIKALKQGSSDLSGISVSLDQMPDVAADYMILKQELAIQQGIYSSLRQQYESTLIEEVSGSKIFSILEKAEVPLMKSGPSRGTICAVAAAAAFLLSVLAAFALEYLRTVRTDPEENGKLKEIALQLKFWKKRRG